MGLSPFAILVLDRDPLQWHDLPNKLKEWAQVTGGWAFIGLIVLVIIQGYRYLSDKDAPPGLPRMLLVAVLGLAISAACFGAGRGIQLVEWLNAPPPDPNTLREEVVRTDKLPVPNNKATAYGQLTTGLLVAGGIAALIGFGVPFLRDLGRLRFRRIGAIARLSFKEAVRRRVIWAPLFILLVFLFPPQWFFQVKPEAEVSLYVNVIYWAMTPIMLLILSLLAAFAIPTDMRNQTIHTVVTKPVERFEIALGRAAGYIGLASVVLLALSVVSLVLIWASQPSAEAEYESYKARVPVYGEMEFRKVYPQGGSEVIQGESVGREWEYRRYIAGGKDSPHRAIWRYDSDRDLRALAARTDAVPLEFSFDIFRTTKGDENKGVTCTFEFIARPWGDPFRPDARRDQAYRDAKGRVNELAKPGDKDWEKLDQLAEQFGYYRHPSKEISDFHTFTIYVPPGLIRAALKDQPGETPPAPGQPRLMIVAKCESPTQFLGLAKRDLYFLAGDEPFWLNFLKGVFGLWLRLVWVIAVAVACSTYLSGVIAWLVVGFLYTTGMFQDYLALEAAGTSIGGGPFESAIRLAQNQNIVTPLQDSAAKSIAVNSDAVYRWFLRRIMDIFPDVDRFSWTNYVSTGFSVPWAEIVIYTLVMIGYLLPWAVLAYYLMKSREVAA